jgi:hypothetical protein
LWKLLYEFVLKFEKKYPSWTVLRHEDVAREPVQTFRQIYKTHGLNFTPEVRDQIIAHSEPSESTAKNGSIRRDSEATVRNWENRLTREEVKKVRRCTKETASEFYDDDEW